MTTSGNGFADYAAINAVNWSTIRFMATSPKLCRHRADHPQPDKDAFRIGRLLHAATIEPERWASEFVVEPDFGEQFTKDGKPAKSPKLTEGYKLAFAEWRASLPAGATIVDPEEYALAEKCAAAIRAHRVAGPLVGAGHREHVLTWTDSDTGLACKARLDLIGQCVVDVKGTVRESVRLFLRDTAEYLYHGQMSWYHDAAIAAGALPAEAPLPVVIGVQKCEPHDVAVLNMTSATYEAGRALYRELLTRYLQCQAAGWWPGFGESMIPWDLPPWALGAERETEGEQW